MGQGKDNAKEFLLENQDVAQEIEDRLRAILLGSDPGPEPESQEEVVGEEI